MQQSLQTNVNMFLPQGGTGRMRAHCFMSQWPAVFCFLLEAQKVRMRTLFVAHKNFLTCAANLHATLNYSSTGAQQNTNYSIGAPATSWQ